MQVLLGFLLSFFSLFPRPSEIIGGWEKHLRRLTNKDACVSVSVESTLRFFHFFLLFSLSHSLSAPTSSHRCFSGIYHALFSQIPVIFSYHSQQSYGTYIFTLLSSLSLVSTLTSVRALQLIHRRPRKCILSRVSNTEQYYYHHILITHYRRKKSRFLSALSLNDDDEIYAYLLNASQYISNDIHREHTSDTHYPGNDDVF